MTNSTDPVNNFAKSVEQRQNRREMFRSLASYLVLGIMGLVWAILSFRSARNSHAAPCVQSLSCNQCPLIDKCERPMAAEIREVGKRQ